MEMTVQYEIWELDEEHGLAPKNDYSGYGKHRIVLLQPNCKQTHDTFGLAVKEIEEKGKTYTEYTILPRIYKTS